MSNITLFEKSKQLISSQESDFKVLAKIHKAVDFKREASFALEALQNNSFLQKTASENPDSLKRAILNVAAIGLTLSPVHKHAYLVPRDGKVMLDLSYKGLVQLAIDAKALRYVQAENVFSKDRFILRGRGQEPIHERNPFDTERGDYIGSYCVAQTYHGDFLVETMTDAEIFAIRDRSQSFIAFKSGKARSCPWDTDTGEMCKKTVIRRASKSWPMTDTRESERLAKAINVFDETESIDVSNSVENADKDDSKEIQEKLEKIKSMLATLGRTEERYLGHLEKLHRRELKTIADLTMIEIDQAIVELTQLVSKPKKDKKDENAKSN